MLCTGQLVLNTSKCLVKEKLCQSFLMEIWASNTVAATVLWVWSWDSSSPCSLLVGWVYQPDHTDTDSPWPDLPMRYILFKWEGRSWYMVEYEWDPWKVVGSEDSAHVKPSFAISSAIRLGVPQRSPYASVPLSLWPLVFANSSCVPHVNVGKAIVFPWPWLWMKAAVITCLAGVEAVALCTYVSLVKCCVDKAVIWKKPPLLSTTVKYTSSMILNWKALSFQHLGFRESYNFLDL